MSSGLQLIDLNELLDGQPVCQVILSSASAKISLFSFGATLHSFEIDLPGFIKRDIVLGYLDWKTYHRTFDFPSNAYMGHVIGPVAGRVANATIPWGKETWSFESNEGKHLLHGGKQCFSNHNWKIKATQQHPYPSVTFELQEKEKFNLPGMLNCSVTYTLKETELAIQIESIAIEDTIANPTQHGYFNPNGHQGNVLETEAFIYTDHYLALNQEKLPSGEIQKIAQLEGLKEPLLLSNFHQYPQPDTAFILTKNAQQAQLVAADGLQLTFSTNQPVFQVYIGGQVPFEGKEQAVYHAHSGICLEQQAEPDAPHHPNFSDIYLKKGHSKINTLTIQFEQ